MEPCPLTSSPSLSWPMLLGQSELTSSEPTGIPLVRAAGRSGAWLPLPARHELQHGVGVSKPVFLDRALLNDVRLGSPQIECPPQPRLQHAYVLAPEGSVVENDEAKRPVLTVLTWVELDRLAPA